MTKVKELLGLLRHRHVTDIVKTYLKQLYASKHNEHKKDTSPTTSNWRQRRIEHSFYTEIVANITTRNLERKDIYYEKKTLYKI